MITTYQNERKETTFTVREWPEVDMAYTTVRVRLPGDYEVVLSAADAQRLGARLQRAGGGSATEPGDGG